MTQQTIAVLLLVVTATQSTVDEPLVQTTSGAIRGLRQIVLLQEVHAFLGIPYAMPPVGDLRFKKSIPAEQWNGTYNATENPPPCMQHDSFDTDVGGTFQPTSEDCLYLNVWVPVGGSNSTLKPIMVWIHGGGFHSGSIAVDYYDGGILAAYGDVVVASMNYRLGVFGFMNADSEDAPGNMGLMDQTLALQWIKNNSKAFGGDPDRITVFGESAGSISVSLHLLSPLSEGLFTRAIMQSGSPVLPLSAISEKVDMTPEEGVMATEALARRVGCVGDNQSVVTHPREIVSCIREVDAQNLTRMDRSYFNMMFMPRYGDEFMPIKPIDVLARGQHRPTDILTGVTSQELSLRFYYSQPELFTANTPPRMPKELGRLQIISQFNSTAVQSPEAIADFYLDGVEDEDFESVLSEVINSVSDVYVVCPTVFFSEAYANINSTVYLYVFDHHPSVSSLPPYMSMTHFDEIQFVFGKPLRDNVTYTEEERDLSRSAMDIWTSFAKYGVPQVRENEVWPTFTPENMTFLQIRAGRSDTGSLERCDFWRGYVE